MNKKELKRELVTKDENTDYGIITKKLGNGNFTIKLLLLNKEVRGRICGRLKKGNQKKNNFVDLDTIVLVGLRDFQDNIVDIIHVYNDNEVRELKKRNEIFEDNIGEKRIVDDVFNFEDI